MQSSRAQARSTPPAPRTWTRSRSARPSAQAPHRVRAEEAARAPGGSAQGARGAADGHAQFIDLCILLGCDYLDPIKGIGPKTALKLIREHKSLENVVEHLKEEAKKSVQIPEHWPFQEARKIFEAPDVQKGKDLDLKWEAPDVEGMVKFLCQDKGFSEDRVRKGCEKLQKSLSQKQQGRLDGFFT